MKKFHPLLRFTAIMAIVFSLLVGCSTKETEKKGDDTPKTEAVTMKDATGAEVKLEKQPTKIISLMPSNTEILYALGLGDKVMAVTDNDTYPEDVKKKDKVGGMEVNVEKVISLKPELVVAHESSLSTLKGGLQQMKDAGIAVFVVKDAKSFADTYSSIDTIGKLTGTSDQATKIVKDMQTKVDALKEKAKAVKDKVNVSVEISGAPDLYVAGKNTFINEMLEIIGAKNVNGDKDGWPKLTEEEAVKSNADVLVTTYGYYTPNAVDGVLKRAAWQNVPAIKNKRVYDVNSDLVSRPGPRLVEGVEALAEVIYPDIFKK